MVVGNLSGDRLPQVTRIAEDPANIVIVIENAEPIDLLDFTSSLTAFAREHETHLRAERPGIDVEETRLLLVDIQKGSILLQLLPALAPIVSTVEYTNTAVSFVKHMKGLYDLLRVPGGRVPDASTQQLKNMTDSIHAIAQDSDGKVTVQARYSNGPVLVEFVVKKEEARQIEQNAIAQRRELTDRTGSQHERVIMRLFQSSIDNLKVGKRTTEKGIVERIDQVPRALVYASDLAGQRIKDEITRPEGNPYEKLFVVDLDVETVGGKPKVYRILKVHDVLEADEE